MAPTHPELERFIGVMYRLRRECPWDREQTHLSLVSYLVEETCEVIEAIEAGSDDDLREELGDLLLQVLFHATIAEEDHRFSLDEVAADVADKLVRRHPYVFADGAVPPDLDASWEQRKRAEKARSSALDGIPVRLSSLVRAQKVLSRARSHDVVPTGLDAPPIGSEEDLGRALLALAASAQREGFDAEQALRSQLRALESRIQALEADG